MKPQKKRESAATAAGTVASPATTTTQPATTAIAAGPSTNTVAPNPTEKMNGHPTEQELFMQAFEKPTQIYRFLRNRHVTNPIFLNRSLSYMKDRMSRSNKKRSGFKVNSMLENLERKSTEVFNYIALIIKEFFKPDCGMNFWLQPGEVADIECRLFRITKNKRKDTSDTQELWVYHSQFFHHDEEEEYLSAICIPSVLMPLEPHMTYKLTFRIGISMINCTSIDANGEIDGPPNKRQRVDRKTYGCDLMLYEKSTRLPPGDYEAACINIMEITNHFSPKKHTWETLYDDYPPLAEKFKSYNKLPILKYRIHYAHHQLPTKIPAKDLPKYFGFAKQNGCEDENGQMRNFNNNRIADKKPLPIKNDKIQIAYHFKYQNNTRQQTESTDELVCPWCALQCCRLYSLLKHLKLCHGRFNFTYMPNNSGASIHVTINDSYDASYSGSSFDHANPNSAITSPEGPVRRNMVTHLLVCRPRRQKTCLDEFLVLDEDELSNQRPYITGHNRLYHHTETCLPVNPNQLDVDSESESDPLWLRQKTVQMIDEFTDVNEGEKELMKLWNLHVMKHGFVGDCQLPLACEMFLAENSSLLISKNLYRNFLLHMSTLFDYGLVSPDTLRNVVQKLQSMISKSPEGREQYVQLLQDQLKHWEEVGIYKQEELKLKTPLKQQPSSSCCVASTSSGKDLSTMSPNTSGNAETKTKRLITTAVKHSPISPQCNLNDSEIEAIGIKTIARKTASELPLPAPPAIKFAEKKSNNNSTENEKPERKTNRASIGKPTTIKSKGSPKESNQKSLKRKRSDIATNSSNVKINLSNIIPTTKRTTLVSQRIDANNACGGTTAKKSASTNSPSTLPTRRITTRRKTFEPLESNVSPKSKEFKGKYTTMRKQQKEKVNLSNALHENQLEDEQTDGITDTRSEPDLSEVSKSTISDMNRINKDQTEAALRRSKRKSIIKETKTPIPVENISGDRKRVARRSSVDGSSLSGAPPKRSNKKSITEIRRPAPKFFTEKLDLSQVFFGFKAPPPVFEERIVARRRTIDGSDTKTKKVKTTKTNLKAIKEDNKADGTISSKSVEKKKLVQKRKRKSNQNDTNIPGSKRHKSSLSHTTDANNNHQPVKRNGSILSETNEKL